jgi:archaellum component FlaF (FlaF/FlaG flagellin family)
MKRLLISLWLMAGFAFAGADAKVIEVQNTSSNAASVVSNTYKFSGYLESIHIDVEAATTQTVVIATADDTLLTATAVTADTTYRVRYPITDAAGAAVGTITNQATRHLLVQEPLTVTVTSTQPTTNNVIVTPKFYNVK